MSVELDIKLCEGLTVGPLVQRAEVVLAKMLRVSVPPVRVSELFEGQRRGVAPTSSLQSGLVLEFHVGESRDETSSLTVTAVPCLPGYADEAGMWAGIMVGVRLPLQFALVACVAVAAAELCQSSIVDESLFWSTSRESKADDFVPKVTLQGVAANLNDAVALFYERLPKGRKFHV